MSGVTPAALFERWMEIHSKYPPILYELWLRVSCIPGSVNICENVITVLNFSINSCTVRSSQCSGQCSAVVTPTCSKKKKSQREKKAHSSLRVMRQAAANSTIIKAKIKWKFVLYVVNTGHMHKLHHELHPKAKNSSLWDGRTPALPDPPPLARSVSVASLPRTLFFTVPPKIKSWLRHCYYTVWSSSYISLGKYESTVK